LLKSVEPGDALAGGMELARVGGTRDTEAARSVLRTARVACAWVGQHKQVKRALVEGQAAGEDGSQTRPIWPAVEKNRDARGQPQQRRLAAGTNIQQVEPRRRTIRQRRQRHARRGQRGDKRELRAA
jgi:hypothetical protein